jgi:hypothetical protein
MKSNQSQAMLLSLALLFSGAAFAAAADKKPVGVSAAEYRVTVEVKDAKVIITAMGAGGYHCNTQYPWKLTAGDKLYTKKEADKFQEDGVVFKMDSTNDKKASLKLSVCNNAQCIMETAELTW